MTLIKTAPLVSVFVDGELQEDLAVLDIQGSKGSDHKHAATMLWQPKGIVTKPIIHNHASLRQRFENKTCEIYIRQKREHWGKIIGGEWQVGETGESVVVTSRIDDHLFGSPVFAEAHNPTGRRPDHIYGDLVFNPLYDGKIVGNLTLANKGLGPLFIHPDKPGNHSLWTLATAAHYLFKQMNTRPEFASPSLAELVFTMGLARLQNVTIPVGMYLPQALSRLLSPFGFEWTLRIETKTKGFRFWKRGHGKETVIDLGRYNTDLRPDAKGLGVTLSIDHVASSANFIVLIGDFLKKESTFELGPAWDPDLESTSYEDFVVDSAEWIANPGVRRVYRDYVLNESGQYTAIRKDFKPFNMSKLFPSEKGTTSAISEQPRRRRRFWPCITLDLDGRPIGDHHGYAIEYQTPSMEEDEWKSLEEGAQVLDGECGIRITSQRLPQYLTKPDIKVRVTATLASDFRLYAEASNLPISDIEDPRLQIIDVGSKYTYNQVAKTSRFWKDVDAGKLGSNQSDDRADLQSLASELLLSWSRSNISGPITLEGVSHNASSLLGKSVGRITGRDISLHFARGERPDVIGYTIDVDQQTTTLLLDKPE